jgi:formylglycine-generating enzyme required for sulfatase activity
MDFILIPSGSFRMGGDKNPSEFKDNFRPVEKVSWNDMHGNVHEWCQDWFDRKYYSQSPSNEPLGPFSGMYDGFSPISHIFRYGKSVHAWGCAGAWRLLTGFRHSFEVLSEQALFLWIREKFRHRVSPGFLFHCRYPRA